MTGCRYKFREGKILGIENLEDFAGELLSPYLKGIFETILVLEKTPVLLERHLDRLYNSASYFSIPLPDREVTKKLVAKEAFNLSAEKGALRVTAQLNESKKETCIMVCEREYPYTEEMYSKGRSVCFSSWKRDPHNPLYRHKVLQQLENRIAREIAEKSGYDDCLFLNLKGNVTEATSANVFVFKNGILKTPPESEGLLKGIVRNLLIELCHLKKEIAVEEKPISADELISAEEVFLTNSLMVLMPVTFIAQRKIGNGTVGSFTKRLSEQIWDYFLENLE